MEIAPGFLAIAQRFLEIVPGFLEIAPGFLAIAQRFLEIAPGFLEIVPGFLEIALVHLLQAWKISRNPGKSPGILVNFQESW